MYILQLCNLFAIFYVICYKLVTFLEAILTTFAYFVKFSRDFSVIVYNKRQSKGKSDKKNGFVTGICLELNCLLFELICLLLEIDLFVV